MAVNLKIKVQLACPHYTISALLLITSVIAFIGALAIKYEFSVIFGNYFEEYTGKPILFLLAGSVLIFVDSCFGLVALFQRWYHGMIAFIMCTAYLLITMIILVAVTYIFSVNTEEAMFLRLEEDMKDIALNGELVDTVQLQLKCCGYNNFSDWTSDLTNVPQSCCIDDLVCDTSNSTVIYSNGCNDAFQSFLCLRKWIVVVVLIVLAIIKVVSIVLSVMVSRDLVRGISATEGPAAANEESNTVTIPRVHNPLGQNSLPTVDNSYRTQNPYVRRPSQRPAELTYRSPHENFLRQPPQLRFDRRIMLPSAIPKNPYAHHPG